MTGERKLVGHDNFVRFNPMSDKFDVKRFHHIEFYCSDATNCARRHTWGFGMPEVAKSDLCTGNKHYASYVVKSNDIVYIFTAPFNNPDVEGSVPPHPGFNADVANKFVIGRSFDFSFDFIDKTKTKIVTFCRSWYGC